MTKKVLLMKNRLKLNIRIFFEEAIWIFFFFLKKNNFEAINLFQKTDLNIKVEHYKFKKLLKKLKPSIKMNEKL